MSSPSGIVLLVDRPGAFRDALAQTVAELGAEVRTTDTVLDALAGFDLAPRAVLVANDVGAPGAAAICRMAQRKLPGAMVFLLDDTKPDGGPTTATPTGEALPRATQVVSRALGAHAIGALLVPERGPALTPTQEPSPAADESSEPPPSVSGGKRSGKSGRHAKVAGAAKRDKRFEEIERLIERGAWDDIADKLRPMANLDNLPPRLAFLYAIAAKESSREGAAANADAVAIRAVSVLFDAPSDSPAAVLVAKRALRRNPATWSTRPAPTTGVSIVFAVAIVAVVGFMAFLLGSGRLQLF